MNRQMNIESIDSKTAGKPAIAPPAKAAQAAATPFYYAASPLASLYQEAFALFWSVFGPAAQYCSSYPKYAYAAASLKP